MIPKVPRKEQESLGLWAQILARPSMNKRGTSGGGGSGEEQVMELQEPLVDEEAAAEAEGEGGGVQSRGMAEGGYYCGDVQDDDDLGRAAVAATADSDDISKATATTKKEMHWVLAGFIIFSFSAPAALVGVPYSVGQVGLGLGLVYCLIVTLASVGGASMLLQLSLRFPGCQNLPELGRAAMGRTGEVLMATVQMANFVLFLPVSLLINAEALQGMLGVSGDQCVDGYILAISVVCFLTTQVRVLANTQALTLLSLTAVFIAAVIQLSIVFTTPNPARVPASLIGHPGPATPFNTINMLLGLTTFSWSYVPSFLTIELASSMPRPSDFHKSLALSALLVLLLFLFIGIPIVHQWGADIPDPLYLAPSWPATLPSSRVMQAMILASNLVSYALDSVPLARYCQRVWVPGFRDDWSIRSVITYALVSLPTFLFGLVASVGVGNLLSLLAFVTALTVPWVTQILPAVLFHSVKKSSSASSSLPSPSPPGGRSGTSTSDTTGGGDSSRRRSSGGGARISALSMREVLFVASVLIVGVITFVVCMTAAIGKVVIKELRGPTVIGCGSWTIYSDKDRFSES